MAILKTLFFVVLEQFSPENISLLSGRLVKSTTSSASRLFFCFLLSHTEKVCFTEFLTRKLSNTNNRLLIDNLCSHQFPMIFIILEKKQTGTGPKVSKYSFLQYPDEEKNLIVTWPTWQVPQNQSRWYTSNTERKHPDSRKN